MTEPGKSSGIKTAILDEQDPRKRLVLLGSIAHLTIILVLVALWLKSALTIQMIVILSAIALLVVNGTVWLGWRVLQTRRKAGRPLKPLFFFLIAAFVGLDAIVETLTRDYASAGMLLTGCVAMILLGLASMRASAKMTAESQ